MFQLFVRDPSFGDEEWHTVFMSDWDPEKGDWSGEPDDNALAIFPTGKEAATLKDVLAKQFPTAKYMIKRLAITAESRDGWRNREKARFEAGEYTPTPWHDEAWYRAKHSDHFAHMSVKDPGKIAFTDGESKGMADRQTQISAGRYLTAHFSDVLTATEIENWATKAVIAGLGIELHITNDPDEVEAVYVGGPESCMRGQRGRRGQHPARVYAAPGDLAVAYIGDKDAATGRVVVWPERKLWTGGFYGDSAKLKQLLAASGYSSGSAEGARIPVIKVKDSPDLALMPYIDGAIHARRDGDFFVLGEGDINVRTQNYYVDLPPECEKCGRGDVSQRWRIEDTGESVCESCIEDAFRCDCTGRFYSTDAGFHDVRTPHDPDGEMMRAGPDVEIVTIRGELWNEDDTITCGLCGGHEGLGFHVADARGVGVGGAFACRDCIEADPLAHAIANALYAAQAAAEAQDRYGDPFSRRLRDFERLHYGTPVPSAWRRTVGGGAWDNRVSTRSDDRVEEMAELPL